jgi:hypothetical protein
MDKDFLVFYFFLFLLIIHERLWTCKSQFFLTFHVVSISHAVCQIINLNFYFYFLFFFCHELTSCDIVLEDLNIFSLLLTHDFVLKQ